MVPRHAEMHGHGVCLQGSRRSSLGGAAWQAVLAVIANTTSRTPKVMYACIKGIPTLKEAWLSACVAAHKLLPIAAFHQDVVQRADGHQAFQGWAVHLAGSAAFQLTWSKLIRHAGTATLPLLFLSACSRPCAPECSDTACLRTGSKAHTALHAVFCVCHLQFTTGRGL